MATSTPSKPSKEIALYERRLDELYKLVEAAIRRVDPGATFVRTTLVPINEQVTGPYTVSSLEASIPGKPGIRLIPRGIYYIGARGRVEARSRLGTQDLMWVEAGEPAVGVTHPNGENEIESVTRPVFAGVPEGWAWADRRRLRLLPLTERVFIDHVLPDLIA